MKTGRRKMTGRREREKKIQLRPWDSSPQPLAYVDKGITTCVKPKGELEMVRPPMWPLSCGRALLALLGGREWISIDCRIRKYSNAC